MKKYLTLITLCLATTVKATNLVEVFDLAVANDPTYKAAQAKWRADRENLNISRATLLPHIAATGSVAKTKNETQDYSSNQTTYAINLTQPIFNITNLAEVWTTQALVKQAEANLVCAHEDLMLRTAQAYFHVLQAQDLLHFTKAQKSAIAKQLTQTKHKFEVGLIAITDVETAQASFDAIIAAEISAANNLSDARERLTEIISTAPETLATIKKELPLVVPQPDNIATWVTAAEQQNYTLFAARFATNAAQHNIKQQRAGHLPTINLGGNYNYTHNTDPNSVAKNKGATVNLSMDLPLFNGGSVLAHSNQANHQYQEALSHQEVIHRNVVSITRQSYADILASISKIKADIQALKSNTSALQSTQAAYSVGTRTMVDILQAESNLYEARKTLAQDQYSYILQTLTLKKMAGILAITDLQQINTWLD